MKTERKMTRATDREYGGMLNLLLINNLEKPRPFFLKDNPPNNSKFI